MSHFHGSQFGWSMGLVAVQAGTSCDVRLDVPPSRRENRRARVHNDDASRIDSESWPWHLLFVLSFVHSTCSGDSEMGVMGLEVRRCLRPLLRRRSLLVFLGAYRGGNTGNAWAMGGTRGGAGASWRKGQEKSSSKSSPKRSASLM